MTKRGRVPTPEEEGELVRLRAALHHEIEKRSLRAVARELEMAPSGLQNFLDGTVPYAATLRKLRDWFFRWRHGAGLSADDVDGFLRQVVRLLDDPAGGLLSLLELIGSLHRESHVAPPEWLGDLRSRYDQTPAAVG